MGVNRSQRGNRSGVGLGARKTWRQDVTSHKTWMNADARAQNSERELTFIRAGRGPIKLGGHT